MNRLIYNGKTYDDVAESGDKLMSASAYIGDSLSAVSLPVDTLTAVIQDYGMYLQLMATDGQPLAADSKLVAAYASGTDLAKRSGYGQTVEYYHNDALFAKFYLESLKRVGKYAYQLSCVSAVGLLLTDRHYGGIYTGQTAKDVIADIICGIFPYVLDEELGATQIYGWLPIATRRDALRDVLFAIGGRVSKDADGDVVIGPQVSQEPYAITADEFYMGGSVTGGNPATGVDVTEHSYSALNTDDTVTLFDGEAAASEIVTPKGVTMLGALVEFSEPIHDLEVTNGVILESGANYAVLAQAPSALLTGKRYTHTTRIISRRKDGSGVPNVATSKTCALVNLMNSELVADRLMAYYGAAKTVEADIVATRQKPGDVVTFTDPFGDATEGFISDMELTMSSIIKARTTLVSDYIPVESGNYYSRVMVVSNSGTVIIPTECKGKIRVVLIGGGNGGLLGTAGTSGGTATTSSYGAAGSPGQPGAPGPGGKVFIKTIPVAPGDSFDVVIGSGGKGATLTTEATDGTPTTFGDLSSADGFTSSVGYMDMVNGTVYGLPGEEGIPGGSAQSWDSTGGILSGETIEYNGVTYVSGSKGGNYEYGSYYGFGGLGGGAAAGANGKDGGSGNVDDNNGKPFADGGNGGDGATPVKAENGKTPGQGGQGGHGGGAGGGGGPAKGSGSSYQWQGQGGRGGDPGEAGDGADGVVLIYYGKDPTVPDGEYLTFQSENPFTISAGKYWDGKIEYFSSDLKWVEWDGSLISSATTKQKHVVRLRGSGNTKITGSSSSSYKWSLVGNGISCVGNIETLLDHEIVEAGGHPAMAKYCYTNMFRGCTALTQAPSLPATTLANRCYYYMFFNCTSLTAAPDLPATTLADYCYCDMFKGCKSLTQAPALPATTLANGCYVEMFSGCTSLTHAPALSATTLATSCYALMFRGCTSLTQAPSLPATTLATSCYDNMFNGCKSLTQAPSLPATTLADSCYYYMFYGCTKIKLSSAETEEYTQAYRIPTSGTGTTATNALASMFTNTGGTFTGTPEVNTTYYLSSDNVIV